MPAEDPSTGPAPAGSGPWSDVRVQAVLDAQDHRDAAWLIAHLTDSSAAVRAQAALALASVGDSSAALPLLKALADPDVVVRSNAAFAFGFCGDSVVVHRFVERYSSEENAAVRGRIAEAMGRVGGGDVIGLLLRRDMAVHMDSLGVLSGLYRAALNGYSDTAAVRFALDVPTIAPEDLCVLAGHLLFRSNAHDLKPFAQRIRARAGATASTEPLIPLLGALGKTTDAAGKAWLDSLAIHHPDPRVRVAALHGLARYDERTMAAAVWAGLDDSIAMVRSTALELMQGWKTPMDEDRLWKVAQEHSDYAIKIPLYALVLKYGGRSSTASICRSLLNAMAQQDLGPYLNAEMIKARDREVPMDTLLRIITDTHRSAVERMAALECGLAHFGGDDPLLATPLAKELVDGVLAKGDAGAIARLAEALSSGELNWYVSLLKPEQIAQARARLHPLRDLEAIQDLDALPAGRPGAAAPKHSPPPFNHPIDPVHLQAMGMGHRYRITTNKGTIDLDTEPGWAPGSCVAFDSLVTVGFYDGRFWHRVVPDFVAQGGCPRGDGYGAMDWTLRTEVGLGGFTTGAVGLASAGKDTESCQFFITLAPAPHLDGRYTRFGQVVSGMDVAQRLTVGDRILSIQRMR